MGAIMKNDPKAPLGARARMIVRRLARALVRRATPRLSFGFALERALAERPRSLLLDGGPESRRAALALAEGRFRHPWLVAHGVHGAPPPGVVFASACDDRHAPGLEAVITGLLRVYPKLENRYVVHHDRALSEFSRRRLARLYPHFEFVEVAAVAPEPSGDLSSLAIRALGIRGADRLVLLAPSLLVLGDLSPLWIGDRVKVVPYVGARPFSVVSTVTGRECFDGGVLSLPGGMLGEVFVERAREVLSGDWRGADADAAAVGPEGFWNALLASDDVEFLPQTFGGRDTYFASYCPSELARVSALRFVSALPWLSFMDEKLRLGDDHSRYRLAREDFPAAYSLWDQVHGRDLSQARLQAFYTDMKETFDATRDSLGDRPVVLIGNGPSLKRTDLSAFDGYEKFAFNWFVNHEDFDGIRPDHLVLASHMLFGGWQTPRPKIPDEYLAALVRHSHKPRIWVSHYFKEYLETVPELRDYQLDYFFFEKPFKRPVATTGRVELDLRQCLVDSNTGVISAAVPIALWMGAKKIVLVGCDSNYSSAAGSYFYAASSHKSATTNQSNLVKTWAHGGQGAYGYEVLRRQLEERHVRIFDATLDGNLHMLEKLTIEEARLRA